MAILSQDAAGRHPEGGYLSPLGWLPGGRIGGGQQAEPVKKRMGGGWGREA